MFGLGRGCVGSREDIFIGPVGGVHVFKADAAFFLGELSGFICRQAAAGKAVEEGAEFCPGDRGIRTEVAVRIAADPALGMSASNGFCSPMPLNILKGGRLDSALVIPGKHGGQFGTGDGRFPLLSMSEKTGSCWVIGLSCK